MDESREGTQEATPLQIGPPVNGNRVEVSFEDFRKARELAALWSNNVDWDGLPELTDVSDDVIRKCLEVGLVGVDPAMLVVMDKIDLYSRGNRPVLITGETGTGKEVVARCLHQLGPQKEMAFVAVNCAGLPEYLIEDQLFGHRKGAFTDASSETFGLVKAAEGGVLFLDEIGELPRSIQAKLLRFVETGEYYRVGGSDALTSSARIVAATNKDLEKAIEDREFRDDLFTRLGAGGEISLPPLFFRLYDFPWLIYRFVREYNLRNSTSISSVSEKVIFQALMDRWRGNVRALERAVQRGCDQAKRKNGHCLKELDIPEVTPVGLGTTWEHGDLFGFVLESEGKELDLGELPAYDPRPFLEALDVNFEPSTRKRWTYQSRKSIMGTEGITPTREMDQPTGDLQREHDPIEAICRLPFVQVRKRYASRLLEKHNQNATAASRVAGVDSKTLLRWAQTKKERKS